MEMAIVLSIMGVLIGFGLPALIAQKSQDRLSITRKNQDIVLHALGAYCQREIAIPCPSPTPSEGLARLDCGHSNLSKCYGYIPYRSLGIPEHVTKDGFGHPMRYAIQPGLIGPKQFCVEKKGELHAPTQLALMDEKRQIVVSPQGHDLIAALLLSEGEAYQKPVSSEEKDNMSANLTFHIKALSTNPEKPFRHIIAWSSRDNLIGYYGQSSCRIHRQQENSKRD